jgi:hypothetical protein
MLVASCGGGGIKELTPSAYMIDKGGSISPADTSHVEFKNLELGSAGVLIVWVNGVFDNRDGSLLSEGSKAQDIYAYNKYFLACTGGGGGGGSINIFAGDMIGKGNISVRGGRAGKVFYSGVVNYVFYSGYYNRDLVASINTTLVWDRDVEAGEYNTIKSPSIHSLSLRGTVESDSNELEFIKTFPKQFRVFLGGNGGDGTITVCRIDKEGKLFADFDLIDKHYHETSRKEYLKMKDVNECGLILNSYHTLDGLFMWVFELTRTWIYDRFWISDDEKIKGEFRDSNYLIYEDRAVTDMVESHLQNTSSSMITTQKNYYNARAGISFGYILSGDYKYKEERQCLIHDRVECLSCEVSGDLSFRLMWFNIDDLNLIITEPNGCTIWEGSRGPSSSNGLMDMEMNTHTGSRYTPRNPVENIFYKNQEDMQEGIYRVQVRNDNQSTNINCGFILEMDHRGESKFFAYKELVRQDITIDVIVFEWSHNNGINIIESLEYIDGTNSGVIEVPNSQDIETLIYLNDYMMFRAIPENSSFTPIYYKLNYFSPHIYTAFDNNIHFNTKIVVSGSEILSRRTKFLPIYAKDRGLSIDTGDPRLKVINMIKDIKRDRIYIPRGKENAIEREMLVTNISKKPSGFVAIPDYEDYEMVFKITNPNNVEGEVILFLRDGTSFRARARVTNNINPGDSMLVKYLLYLK